MEGGREGAALHLDLFLGEAVVVVPEIVQVHAVRVVAGYAANEVVAVLRCPERRTQHVSINVVSV